jgi:type I pantothenate kinase
VVSRSPDPYVELTRADWSRLSHSTPLPLTEHDVARLRGLCDPITLTEVDEIYRPISRLLYLYIKASGALYHAAAEFLDEDIPRTPYVIGIAGSVAVGKSTVARVLREMISRWPQTPRVDLVTTDGFLFPNAVLEKRCIMERKGFPESYDQQRLLRFVRQIKASEPEVSAPVYSHLTYDVVPGAAQVIRHPDVLIIEGINVLQPSKRSLSNGLSDTVSDFFDFSIYVDAKTSDIKRWYINRFLALRATAFSDPDSYFHRFAKLSDADATAVAENLWDTINEPNLEQNILSTKGRADLILTKGADHNVRMVKLRKI